MCASCVILLLAVSRLFAAGGLEPRWSPDGNWLLYPAADGSALGIWSPVTQESAVLAEGPGCARWAVWAPDSGAIGCKLISVRDGQQWQQPVLVKVPEGMVQPLSEPVPLCGTPSFSADGRIAVALQDELVLFDPSGKELSRCPLESTPNLTPLSPDGSRVLYADSDGALWLVDMATGQHASAAAPAASCFDPRWAPDGSEYVYWTIDGQLHWQRAAAGVVTLGQASEAQWLSDCQLLLARQTYAELRLLGSELFFAGPDWEAALTATVAEHETAPSLSPDGQWLAYILADAGTVFCAEIGPDGFIAGDPVLLPALETDARLPDVLADLRTETVIRGVPFHHQVYDTPYDFNGYGACGATSATMAIAYYGRFSNWNFTATSPFDHTSHYGNYVSEIYTYGGFTFNIYADGGYGGHGYIWQSPVDTKTHMAEYIEYHNLDSWVDWSPSWSELQTKVGARQPFVLLSSITTSGHYKTVTGYIDGQHTAVFNDPYGNKNQGYMNYNGAGVYYDWPGYNNGYQNLNTVHCYIYANGTAPAIERGTADDPITVSTFPYSNSNTTRSSGGSDGFNYYSCASSVNESGREKVYRLTIPSTGTLNAAVSCDQEVDIDLHLLSSLNASACIVRADVSFSQAVTAGTYYLTCDTYMTGGVELMGDYSLSLTFTSSASATPTRTPTVAPTRTPTPGGSSVIVDDGDAGFSVLGGSWGVSTYGENYNGSKHYCSSGTGSGSVRWTASLPAGTYQVEAWINNADYSTAAYYTVAHAGGNTARTQSQARQGGQWCIPLGTYSFAGTGSVTLTDNTTGGTVAADAIRWLLTTAATATPTLTAAPATNTPTRTPTIPPTATPTNQPSATPTNPPTATRTNAPTSTPPVTPSATPPTGTPTTPPSRTPTSTPTNTPASTPPTGTPTRTPTVPPGTPTRTPTAPPGTPTRTPTGSPAPTESPESTPDSGTPTPGMECQDTGVTLILPQTAFTAGDVFSLEAEVCNATAAPFTSNPLFVILDVYGQYWFAPAWTRSINYYVRELRPGTTLITVLPAFAWPANAGAASGIVFWAALTDPSMTAILGLFDHAEFAFS